MNLPLIPLDKANHFIYGLVIFIACSSVLNVTIGLIICIIAAFGMELYDFKHKNKHTPDIMDAVYTCVGGIVGLIAHLII